ncbi:hypothetical protein TSUD_311240 [Trifolium subterraneum]|uniref:Protein kinase domain-containing protein n=1 Tax=Trifolium subterraneum TaxID=3900 RepID=A0A2Z6MK19_TRISU|nr:hypothetical protein TSUD_311240 [Trifolium subterraneum]
MGNCLSNSGVDNKIQKKITSTTYKQHNNTSSAGADDERSTVGAKIAAVEKERGGERAVGKIVTPNLKMFTLEELKSATRNFRPDTVLGEGGFGRVFKGWIDKNTLKPSKIGVGIPVAVKKSNDDSLQGLQEWQDFNAKLSDFGLAKLGPVNGRSHVTTRIMGTYGYAAPEYMATGHLYVKSDVYGFGVVLLEMLTGLIALDPNRPTHEMNLVEFTKSSLSDKKKLKKIMDQRLDKNYPLTSAFVIAQVILKCLESDPKNRPSMEQVLETLERAQTIKVKPKVKKSRSSVHQT